MKKAMLFIVAMMFTASVNAATLNVAGVGDTLVGFTIGQDSSEVTVSGALVLNGSPAQSNASVPWEAKFNLTTDVDTNVALTAQLAPLTPLNFDIFKVKNGGILETIALLPSTGLGSGMFLALASETYRIVIRSAVQKTYNLTASAVPVPAALFLFAPALLGLFGLRRKASLAA